MLTQELYIQENFQNDSFLPYVLSGLHGQQQCFQKYDFIYLNPSSEKKIYFVLEGLVRLGNYTAEGKDASYCLLGEGAIIGSFVQMEQDQAFAQAYSDVVLIAFTEAGIKKLFYQDSSTALALFKLMNKHVQAMEEQFRTLAYCDVPQRIIRFVLYLADLYGYRHQRITFIPHHFTHEDISLVIHTSRQTVTATLRELQKQGYLSYRRGEFRIYRYDELSVLASKCMQQNKPQDICHPNF